MIKKLRLTICHFSINFHGRAAKPELSAGVPKGLGTTLFPMDPKDNFFLWSTIRIGIRITSQYWTLGPLDPILKKVLKGNLRKKVKALCSIGVWRIHTRMYLVYLLVVCVCSISQSESWTTLHNQVQQALSKHCLVMASFYPLSSWEALFPMLSKVFF